MEMSTFGRGPHPDSHPGKMRARISHWLETQRWPCETCEEKEEEEEETVFQLRT